MKPWVRNPLSRAAWSGRALPAIGAAVLLLLASKPSARSIALALPLVVAGESLRIWAAGHLHKTRELAIGGPYARLRHPLYAGTLLIATGFCLMAGGHVAALATPLLLAFFLGYYLPRKEAREAARLERRHGEAFAAYRAAVPALLPRATPWRPRIALGEPTRWSAARVRDNDEAGVALLVLLTLAILCARALAG